MNKILIISYHYHPDLAVGAMRAVKFAKYLPENGWEPVILTVKSKYHSQIDISKSSDNCKVYRTLKLPVFDDIYLKLKSILLSDKSNNKNNSYSNSDPSGNSEELLKRTPLWKRMIFSFSNTPDNKIGWILPGVFKGLRIIKQENIDVIYSSGPPWTCHIIGLLLKLFLLSAKQFSEQ